MSRLTAAILAYTGHGTAKTPRDDERAVRELENQTGEVLLSQVKAALADVEAIDMSDVAFPSDSAGPVLRERLGELRPDLDPVAVAALANWWAFRRVWLGIPSPVERPRYRYFVRYALREGQRIPCALFRREDDGARVVDSVLKDVGVWQEDARRRIWAHLFTLDNDLEPITARQAEEFQQMVAERRYRPFTT